MVIMSSYTFISNLIMLYRYGKYIDAILLLIFYKYKDIYEYKKKNSIQSFPAQVS
jgi:hypothetical protein